MPPPRSCKDITSSIIREKYLCFLKSSFISYCCKLKTPLLLMFHIFTSNIVLYSLKYHTYIPLSIKLPSVVGPFTVGIEFEIVPLHSFFFEIQNPIFFRHARSLQKLPISASRTVMMFESYKWLCTFNSSAEAFSAVI